MVSRGSVIAALCAVELAILFEATVAMRGGISGPRAEASLERPAAVSGNLVEGGAHATFAAAAHPALTVDIGYADLTIVAESTGRIDVAVRKGSAFGMLGSNGAISARDDGGAVRITAAGGRGLSVGDDRMVTVVVPPQTAVSVIRAGDIRATGLRAAASFASVGSGTVTIEDFNASSLDVAGRNGRVTLRRIVTARLNATSHNSRIDATGLQVHDGSVEANDRVSLAFAPGSDTTVAAQAESGHISTSGFPASAIVNARKSDDDDSASQTVRVGAGSGHLDVTSSDGNIALSQ